jgi:DNA-directed RNA polymerase specialized sigma24 family protein
MGIEMDKPPREMSLPELADCCLSEIQHYKPGERYSEQCCLEICRRSMLQNDARAWEILMQRFHGIVLNWVRRHPQRESACAIDSEENYVALTFERFWKVTVRNKNLEFSSLGAALVFLRSCVNSVIIDTLRGQREVPLPEGFEREAPEPDESYQRWEVIKSFLPNEREQRLAYLLYYCNLKPRQIVQLYPGEFKDTHEIFRLTRNIIDRLRRNKERLRWLLGDDEF